MCCTIDNRKVIQKDDATSTDGGMRSMKNATYEFIKRVLKPYPSE
ncbi:hypothetical protein [Proteus mirabilis]